MNIKTLFISILLASGLAAQEGKTIYQTYCSACHGESGEGRKGAAPALSQSSWVNGNPIILSDILLHGLQGKLTMHGEEFELVMPAQSTLNNKQMADVATYVRSQWGNKADPISEDFIKKREEKNADQVGVINTWKFNNGWKLNNGFEVRDLTFKVDNLLSAEFPYTTDFDSLKGVTPDGIEEEKEGLLDPRQVNSPDKAYTGKWSGLINIKQAGDYDFSFGTENAARITIDGKVLLERAKGTDPSVGSIKLAKGLAEIEVYYAHEAKAATFFRLFISGPDMNMLRLHSMNKRKPAPAIKINPTDERALVHRNFLVKSGERTLAVGLPQRVNFYFSTQSMRLTQLWNGEFLDAGATWIGRANGKLAMPLGEPLSVLSEGEVFKTSSAEVNSWADANLKSVDQRFIGYHFDDAGAPIFSYTIGGYTFSEHYTAQKGIKKLTRKITITAGEEVTSGLHWKLLEDVKKLGEASYKSKNGVQLNFLASSSTPLLLENDVVVKITQPTTITLEYAWE